MTKFNTLSKSSHFLTDDDIPMRDPHVVVMFEDGWVAEYRQSERGSAGFGSSHYDNFVGEHKMLCKKFEQKHNTIHIYDGEEYDHPVTWERHELSLKLDEVFSEPLPEEMFEDGIPF